jgi:RNA polymerase sigma-70 factor (ECF subfamily)
MPEQIKRRQWVLALLERHEVSLLRYATRLLGDADLAGEAVQHAFLQLCDQSPTSLAGREAPWLFRVCRNKGLDLLRARQKFGDDADDELSRYAGREPDPADWAEQQDTCSELRRRVAQLPESQREALGLWCEGFSYREIAEIAEQSEGNVRVLVHRAVKQLRHVLAVE